MSELAIYQSLRITEVRITLLKVNPVFQELGTADCLLSPWGNRILVHTFGLRRLVRRILPGWQDDAKHGPTLSGDCAAPHANGSMVPLHDVGANPKAQARSDVCLGGEKWLENPRPNGWRDARPGIGNGNAHSRGLAAMKASRIDPDSNETT